MLTYARGDLAPGIVEIIKSVAATLAQFPEDAVRIITHMQGLGCLDLDDDS